jgi:NAD(P)H-flavin reductase
MQSLLEDALGKNPDRHFKLYWGGRTMDSLYGIEQIARWQKRHANFSFVGVLSDEAAVAPLRRGLVHEAVLADYGDLADYDIYVCGAPGLVQAARKDFIARGLPADRYYADSFVTPEAAVDIA